MALANSRSITVQGHSLRWAEASRHDRNAGLIELQLLVQIASGKGQRLVVRLPWGAEAAKSKGVSRPLLPAWISRCITAALERGYDPTKPGPAWTIALASLLPDEPWPLTSRELKAALANTVAVTPTLSGDTSS